ncbi:MAG: methionine ABC transporter ATP-binding protein [Azospirillaceae bacterium]|nr:methionine ABC transporter ATP-binding protein [Azospirillaceae bacterium]
MIELQQIEKRFSTRTTGDAVRALDGIDLTINAGEIFGIIGRSGAGKSTLLRVINMLERPTAGRVLVDGVDMARLNATDLRAARRHIGMIFQHFNLLSSRTVFANVALPLQLAGTPRAQIGARVAALLDLVGLTALRDRYPAELSGGQKQRVGIARALASGPKVLLCDEATSALDPETTRAILRLLADINAKLGLTIVLITHEMPVIREICHRVAVIEAGRIIEQGTVFDIFTRSESPITRSFIDQVMGRALPEHLQRLLRDQPQDGDQTVLRITFTGNTATDPVISMLSRTLGVDLNILHGQIDYIRDEPFGILVVATRADPSQRTAIEQFLTRNQLGLEVLGYVAANPVIAV